MKWIMDGIANVILEALNDILIFSINLVTGFKLEVWDETSDFGLIFGSIVKGFMSSILVLSMFLVIMCSILKLYQAMGGPFTQSEEPGVIAVRTIFAGLGTVFAYDTFEFMTKAFNGVYTLFVNVYTGAAADYMSGSWIPSTEDAESARESVSNATPANPRVDIDLRPNSATEAIRNAADNSVFNFFGGDHLINGSTDPSIGLVILEAVIGCALIICFFKLVVEVYIRYILIGVMYITAPLAFSTLISKTSNIFKNWCHMIVSQYILMCFNLLFLGTFVGAWYKILEQAQTNGYVFTDAKQYLTTMFLLIGWLITGQSMDEHLRALGLSAATTGSGIMGAMMGGAAMAGAALRSIGGLAGSAAKNAHNAATGQTRIQKAVEAGREGRGGGLYGEIFGNNSSNRAAKEERAAAAAEEKAAANQTKENEDTQKYHAATAAGAASVAAATENASALPKPAAPVIPSGHFEGNGFPAAVNAAADSAGMGTLKGTEHFSNGDAQWHRHTYENGSIDVPVNDAAVAQQLENIGANGPNNSSRIVALKDTSTDTTMYATINPNGSTDRGSHKAAPKNKK